MQTKDSLSLRVMTYNIQNYVDGPGWDTTRKYLVAELINISNVDVVALQEIRINASSGKNMLNELQALLPQFPYAVYFKGMQYSGGLEEGLGIISKWPMQYPSYVALSINTVYGDLNTRICEAVAVEIAEGFVVDIVNTHWSYLLAQQPENCADTLQYLTTRWPCEWNNITAHYSIGFVLAGDFNNKGETSTAVNTLLSSTIQFGVNSSNITGLFVDTWRLLHPLPENGNTWPSSSPTDRCDHIFYLAMNTSLRVALKLQNSTFQCSLNNSYGSDHCAVYSTFYFPFSNANSSDEILSSEPQIVSCGFKTNLALLPIVILYSLLKFLIF